MSQSMNNWKDFLSRSVKKTSRNAEHQFYFTIIIHWKLVQNLICLSDIFEVSSLMEMNQVKLITVTQKLRRLKSCSSISGASKKSNKLWLWVYINSYLYKWLRKFWNCPSLASFFSCNLPRCSGWIRFFSHSSFPKYNLTSTEELNLIEW